MEAAQESQARQVTGFWIVGDLWWLGTWDLSGSLNWGQGDESQVVWDMAKPAQ